MHKALGLNPTLQKKKFYLVLSTGTISAKTDPRPGAFRELSGGVLGEGFLLT
jgi:hypothetical protein